MPINSRYYHLYQHFPSNLRQHLKIDGEPTVEFDLDACIIQMMYHLEGLKCPEDPYGMIIDGNFDIDDNVMPEIQTLPNNKILAQTIDSSNAPFPVVISYPQDNKVITKKLHKFFQIVLFNAKSENSATKAIIQKLNKSGVSGFDKVKIEAFIELFKKVHEPIAHRLFTDVAGELQFRESNIANQVMLHFARKDVMCLCIHDSYRIAESHKDELLEVVKLKYKDEFGFNPMLSDK
jgi:hypothetical protein